MVYRICIDVVQSNNDLTLHGGHSGGWGARSDRKEDYEDTLLEGEVTDYPRAAGSVFRRRCSLAYKPAVAATAVAWHKY